MLDFLGIFLLLTGYVIGLGAVTVIDLHGFMARKSSYWTEATIRTHKITKPLIWAGIFFAVCGGVILYRQQPFWGLAAIHAAMALILALNGLFLSFWVSPRLLEREKSGQAKELLPKSWQRAIAASFVVSALGWWGSLAIFAANLKME